MQERKEINIEIGQRIKEAREKAGLTQERFSELIGLGPKSVSALERGTVGISLTTLKKYVWCCRFPATRFFLESVKRTSCPSWLPLWSCFPRRNSESSAKLC